MAKKIKIDTIRHSLAHIMASAVQTLYPGVKIGIGPAIENGFYYDFEFPKPISNQDLAKIERKMKEILQKDIVFKKEVVSKQKAKKIFKDQPYKLELLKEIKGEISIYRSGDFVDLCRGPHVRSTKQIPKDGFKLIKIAGAYWRGDEKNPMLTRIYGVAFANKKDLDKYLILQKELEKRDHRLLGKKLELFIIDEEFGRGLILWLPKGALLRKLIMDFALETYLKNGYQLVATPHIANLKLWQRSGHWDFYRENMYSPIKVEKEKYVIKPMNCPGHVKIYASKIRSYKDLPLRLTEMGTVYRYERSGVLHGLTRVRGFTQDDAHIFCTPEQIEEEITKMIDLTLFIYKAFGFKDFRVSLSVRDPKNKEKYLGKDKVWKIAESALEKILKEKKIDYKRHPGEAAFYGPKIDFLFKDAIGREWQLTTIQVDFNFPEKFDLYYIDSKGKKQRPIMLHRALLGSIERFIGVLLENYAGALPFWLSPEQVWIIPVGSKHRQYAKRICEELKKNEIRAVAKLEKETVSKKIREGEVQKIPFMLVVGDKELKTKSVRVREREKGDRGMVSLPEFLNQIIILKERRK